MLDIVTLFFYVFVDILPLYAGATDILLYLVGGGTCGMLSI